MAVAALASTLPLAALADTTLNLDTGATGSSGGDILFNPGTSISPQGTAKLSNLSTAGSAEFSLLSSESILATMPYSTTPISGSSLAANEVFAVHTNGGNYGLVLLTAVSGTSVTLQYVTYNTSGTKIQGATVTLGGAAAPTITMLQNNYSYILPNAPNYGIAPGTLFIVVGSTLAAPGSPAVLQNPANPLPQTLNGSTVSVTVNGTTVQPAFYYALPTQLGLVLPSSTPVGTGTITVSYGGQISAAAPIKVVAHAFGFDFYGGALAAATDNNDGHLITTSRSAQPGETIAFWGTGVGADSNNTDVGPPTHFDNLSGITALYFGGVQVPIVYQGRSGYQGVDEVVVTVPANSPTGCAVSVSAVSGSGSTALTSNFVAIPIATNGGTCVDPLSYVTPTQASTLSGQATVRFGALSIAQLTDSTGTKDEASGIFYSISGASLTGYQSSSQPSLGSCFVTQSNSATPVNPFTFTGLNAGSISVTGPTGTQALTGNSLVPGVYVAEPLPAGFVPASGGSYTFKGTGGTDVGAFSNASLNFSSPLVWTNSSSDGTVNRAQGVTVNWTGGGSSGYAQITGSSAFTSAGFSASFICNVPVSALTFTVPASVLLALPAGTGTLSVGSYTNPVSFTPPSGLDFAYTMADATTTISATYN
jgi:uncharacterized protein (TIGR03437 family)